MEKKLVIIVIIVILIIVAISSIGVLIYLNIEENKRIDREAITLLENLDIEFGKKVKVSDFIANINGTLIDDYEINTNHLGKIEVPFEYINIKNKEKKSTFTINVIDITPPKILSGGSYTVKQGYNKKLEDVLLSGDNVDDNPKREIIGEYDFNTIGEYNLTYVVTDSSGNKTEKPFKLQVVEKINTKKKTSENIYIEDAIKKYKTDNTKIGIDVSKWQGDIDWEKVKNSRIEFAMIRLGYQTDYDGECVLDPYFNKNIENAIATGIPVGLYFHSYAKSKKQAEEQAKWVVEQITEYNISLPIAFDWESWTSFNTTQMSFYTINNVANTFLDSLKNAGYKTMLYGSKNYLINIWTLSKHDIWLAHYTEKTDYEGNYSMWQMCETGRVDGINENVDIDIMYI